MAQFDSTTPPFCHMLAASPDGEVWDHTDDTNKFQVRKTEKWLRSLLKSSQEKQ